MNYHESKDVHVDSDTFFIALSAWEGIKASIEAGYHVRQEAHELFAKWFGRHVLTRMMDIDEQARYEQLYFDGFNEYAGDIASTIE